MTASLLNRTVLAVYLVSFFIFLLGPLVVMAVSAFNTPSYPQVWPIEGVTLEWFKALMNDANMIEGVRKSLLIGFLVVLLSVPTGLAGAILMTQIHKRARSLYYLVVISPVLTPGIILGISTVVFWREVTDLTGLRFMYNGVVMTVLGQSSFISAYCMLIILSRLQRFDGGLEEAAFDLGATYPQVFRDILVPFLRPALLSSAVIAFLSSFENYNTTTFAILADKTLTTVLAGQVRQGTTPAISALATIIVVLTIVVALVYARIKQSQDRKEDQRHAQAMAAEKQELAAA